MISINKNTIGVVLSVSALLLPIIHVHAVDLVGTLDHGVRIKWSGSYVTSCVGVGGVGGWNGHVIAGGDSFADSYTIPASALSVGTLNFQMNCVDYNGATLSPVISVQIPSPDIKVGAYPLSQASSPFYVAPTLTITTSRSYVPPLDNAVITWNFSNPNGTCTGSGGAGSWSTGQLKTSGTVGTPVNYSKVSEKNYNYTITCTDGVTTRSASTGNINVDIAPATGGCFVPGTFVTMSDSSQKSIELVQVGDSILTPEGARTVIATPRNTAYAGKLYAFNGSGHYFVTPSHPFMTPEGWKSINPAMTHAEDPGLSVGKLKVGDTILREDGSQFLLTTLEAREAKTTVYNLTIDGTHEYYADGYLVHNKIPQQNPD